MMNENIKVSVIIPVYNSAQYLTKCIESMLNQTLKEIEIICVDDGSTDESLAIIKNYKKLDSRIKILTQENKYAGVARNNGMRIAKGEYLFFLDSDDFSSDTLLEKVYFKGKDTNADVVFFGAKQYHEETNTYTDANWYFNRKRLPQKDVFNKYDVPDEIFNITSVAPWTKVFRREFVQNEKLQYQALKNSNDLYFVMLAECLADRITFVNEDLTYYRVGRKGSLQNSKDKDPLCFMKAMNAVYKELVERKIYEVVKRSFDNTYINTCRYNMTSTNDIDVKKIVYKAVYENSKNIDCLDYEDTYYYNLAFVNVVRSAKKVLEFWDLQERKYDDEIICVKQSKINGPILISVIVPVYNVENYVEQTIDSLINQSLKNIEIICINDGSTDKSLEVLKTKYSNINKVSIYTQNNQGLSSTRNNGVRLARGKYIYFIDSDDLLEDNALETMYNKLDTNKLDILFFDAESFFEDCDKSDMDSYYARKNEYSDIYSGIDLMKSMSENGEYRASACLQIFNREFYIENNLQFINGILHEDNAFTFNCLLNAKRASHIQQRLYKRRVRSTSITTMSVTYRHVYGLFKCYENMIMTYLGKDIPLIYLENILTIIKAIKYVIRAKYKELDDINKLVLEQMNPIDREIFNSLVLKDLELSNTKNKVNNLTTKINELSRKNTDCLDQKMACEKEIDHIKRSYTYKIGSFILFIPKKIKRFVKYMVLK